jgi:hypothetical protein
MRRTLEALAGQLICSRDDLAQSFCLREGREGELCFSGEFEWLASEEISRGNGSIKLRNNKSIKSILPYSSDILLAMFKSDLFNVMHEF